MHALSGITIIVITDKIRGRISLVISETLYMNSSVAEVPLRVLVRNIPPQKHRALIILCICRYLYNVRFL